MKGIKVGWKQIAVSFLFALGALALVSCSPGKTPESTSAPETRVVSNVLVYQAGAAKLNKLDTDGDGVTDRDENGNPITDASTLPTGFKPSDDDEVELVASWETPLDLSKVTELRLQYRRSGGSWKNVAVKAGESAFLIRTAAKFTVTGKDAGGSVAPNDVFEVRLLALDENREELFGSQSGTKDALDLNGDWDYDTAPSMVKILKPYDSTKKDDKTYQRVKADDILKNSITGARVVFPTEDGFGVAAATTGYYAVNTADVVGNVRSTEKVYFVWNNPAPLVTQGKVTLNYVQVPDDVPLPESLNTKTGLVDAKTVGDYLDKYKKDKTLTSIPFVKLTEVPAPAVIAGKGISAILLKMSDLTALTKNKKYIFQLTPEASAGTPATFIFTYNDPVGIAYSQADKTAGIFDQPVLPAAPGTDLKFDVKLQWKEPATKGSNFLGITSPEVLYTVDLITVLRNNPRQRIYPDTKSTKDDIKKGLARTFTYKLYSTGGGNLPPTPLFFYLKATNSFGSLLGAGTPAVTDDDEVVVEVSNSTVPGSPVGIKLRETDFDSDADTPPGLAYDTGASGLNGSIVSITWAEPASKGKSFDGTTDATIVGVDGYKVEYKKATDSDYVVFADAKSKDSAKAPSLRIIEIAGSNPKSYYSDVSGLALETSYTFRVTVINNTGKSSSAVYTLPKSQNLTNKATNPTDNFNDRIGGVRMVYGVPKFEDPLDVTKLRTIFYLEGEKAGQTYSWGKQSDGKTENQPGSYQVRVAPQSGGASITNKVSITKDAQGKALAYTTTVEADFLKALHRVPVSGLDSALTESYDVYLSIQNLSGKGTTEKKIVDNFTPAQRLLAATGYGLDSTDLLTPKDLRFWFRAAAPNYRIEANPGPKAFNEDIFYHTVPYDGEFYWKWKDRYTNVNGPKLKVGGNADVKSKTRKDAGGNFLPANVIRFFGSSAAGDTDTVSILVFNSETIASFADILNPTFALVYRTNPRSVSGTDNPARFIPFVTLSGIVDGVTKSKFFNPQIAKPSSSNVFEKSDSWQVYNPDNSLSTTTNVDNTDNVAYYNGQDVPLSQISPIARRDSTAVAPGTTGYEGTANKANGQNKYDNQTRWNVLIFSAKNDSGARVRGMGWGGNKSQFNGLVAAAYIFNDPDNLAYKNRALIGDYLKKKWKIADQNPDLGFELPSVPSGAENLPPDNGAKVDATNANTADGSIIFRKANLSNLAALFAGKAGKDILGDGSFRAQAVFYRLMNADGTSNPSGTWYVGKTESQSGEDIRLEKLKPGTYEYYYRVLSTTGMWTPPPLPDVKLRSFIIGDKSKTTTP